MLPSSFILREVDECPGLYCYVMDLYLGQTIHFWCFFDLVFAAVFFALTICRTIYIYRVIGT